MGRGTNSAKEGGPGVRRVVGDAKGGWRGGVSAGAGVWGAVQGVESLGRVWLVAVWAERGNDGGQWHVRV